MTKVIVRIAVLSVISILTSCKSSKPAQEPVSLTPRQQAGQEIFNQTCAVCHRNAAHGPSLVGLYQKKSMTNGMPVNDDRVRDTIRLGRGMMPSFSDVLNQQQTDDVIAYLHAM